MRLKQKIVTFFITITVAVSFPLSYAKSPSCFEDVNPLHKYYSSIQKAYENNRVHGFGNGRFSPDSYLRNDEFIYLLKNYFGSNEKFFKSFDFLLLNYKVKNEDISFVTYEYFLTLSLKGADIYLFDSILYNCNLNLSQSENAVYVLNKYNLKDFNKESYEYITRGEAVYILEFLMQNDFYQPTPSFIKELSITFESPFYKSYCDYLLDIPPNILNKFKAQGWQIVFGDTYLKEYEKKNSIKVIGLTSYSKKTIYILEKESIYHEFGHYVNNLFGISEKYNYVFLEEKESSRELFREYALTNSREYFADCFSYWIRYGEDENKMQNFKEVLPETYEIFYQLYKNKWEHI